jgi:cation diffusion facilitator family transporter
MLQSCPEIERAPIRNPIFAAQPIHEEPMHSHSIAAFEHAHNYLGEKHDRHERRTWFVVILTAAMMVAEIIGGHIYGSMALVADGWHMSTHAGALAIAALAYRFARRHARDPRFTFGTGKLGELAGFASAVILLIVALLIGYESMERLIAPIAIDFGSAIAIAVAGLAVNLVSAWLLYDQDHHGHSHGHHARDHHAHEHHHVHGHDGHDHHSHDHHSSAGHADHNIRAAYLHVLADAMTSVLAIVALGAGRLYGWSFLDPVMGIVGALVIVSWSVGLLRSAGAVLVDAMPDRSLATAVRRRLEIDGDRVSDLHLWRLGPGHTALIAAIVSDDPQAPEAYKERLRGVGLSHVTVEVHRCAGAHA